MSITRDNIGFSRGKVKRGVIQVGSPYLPGKTNFFVLEHDGVREWTRTCNACCMYYKISGEVCSTCPRIPKRERPRPVPER